MALSPTYIIMVSEPLPHAVHSQVMLQITSYKFNSF